MINRESKNRADRQGFTLREALVAVVIFGIVASVVIAQIRNTSDDVARATFVIDGYKFIEAAARYRLDTGEFLERSDAGELPAGFEEYIIPEQWLAETSIGGRWVAEFDKNGVTSAIGVHFKNGKGKRGKANKRDDAFMQQIDANIDDGDLKTGAFRKIERDRYYFIIAD